MNRRPPPITTSGQAGATRDAAGLHIHVSKDRRFLAKITGNTGSAYAWSRYLPGPGGVPVADPAGFSGTATVNPAYERNGGTGVAAGTFVELEPFTWDPALGQTYVFDAAATVQLDDGSVVGPGTTDVQFDHTAFALTLLAAGIVVVGLKMGGTLGIVTNVCPTFGSGSGSGYITGLTVEVTPVTLPNAYAAGSASCVTNPTGCCGVVDTACCPNGLPGTMHVTLHYQSGSGNVYDGLVIPLTYSATSGQWSGSALSGCTNLGHPVTIFAVLQCSGTTLQLSLDNGSTFINASGGGSCSLTAPSFTFATFSLACNDVSGNYSAGLTA